MPEEDLIIGKTEEGEEEPTGEEEECNWDESTLHEEIASATNALMSIDGIDEQLLSKEKGKMIRTIRRKALEILHNNINEIHRLIFDEEKQEE